MASEAAHKIAVSCYPAWDRSQGQNMAYETLVEKIDAAIAAAVRQEREACAAVCEQHDNWRWLRETYPAEIEGSWCEAAFGAGLCAAAIRARNKETPDEQV